MQQHTVKQLFQIGDRSYPDGQLVAAVKVAAQTYVIFASEPNKMVGMGYYMRNSAFSGFDQKIGIKINTCEAAGLNDFFKHIIGQIAPVAAHGP